MMDILPIITSLGGLILGGGGIGAIMHYKHESRAKELTNERSEMEISNSLITQWKDLYLEAEAKSQSKSNKIEELYQRLTKRSEQLAKMTVQRDKLATFKCWSVACSDRKPPILVSEICEDCESSK